MELEHSTATVLGKIDIAFGVRCDAVNLVEFTRKLPDPSKGRYHLAGLPIDDFDFRIVLVDVEDVFLIRVRGECKRYHRAAGFLDLAVGRRGDGLPRNLDRAFEDAHLVIDLNAGMLPVADIHLTVTAQRQAVHALHAFRLPLPQEFSAAVHHRNAAIDAGAFAIRNIDIAILWISVDAGGHEELRG